MFANNNLALSNEILYLSQTRFVDGLGVNSSYNKNITKSTGLEKIAQAGDSNNSRAANTSNLQENIEVLSETVLSAKEGLKELDQSYGDSVKNLRIYLNSEEGSNQKAQAKKEILEIKDSISEIQVELKELKSTQDLTEIDSLIHNIVSSAIKDASSTFSNLNLEESDEALKGYYNFQKDRNNLNGRIKQLESIEAMLRESKAGVYQINVSNKTNIPSFGSYSNLVNNDFLESNKNDTNLMLNFLNLNQRSSGRLFSYYS
jgi:hypothetical protein